MKKQLYVATVLTVFVLFCSCLGGCKQAEKKPTAVAVFVPGVVSGSPVYEMLVEGVTQAVNEHNAQAKDAEKVLLDVIEAGTNQAEWGSKLTALSSTGQYSLIISSNSSLPALVEPLTVQFPSQKFLLLDAYLSGNANIATVNYNQREQSYLTGYAAGLATTASADVLPFANAEKKIALIAAQEYPVMNDTILPGFIEGAKAVDADITVEFRIVGNWYDASKSSEIARSLYQNGVDVILPISGGANQGVIASAQALNFYVTWFDDNGYAKAPGFVISSTIVNQQKMAYEQTKLYLSGGLQFGTAETVGMKEGYIDYVGDDSVCIEHVPEEMRTKMLNLANDIKSGKLSLPM